MTQDAASRAAAAVQPGYYSKLPVVIKAVQWDGKLSGVRAIEAAFPALHTAGLSSWPKDDTVSAWAISTLEGTSYDVSKGDWIICGIKGEFYPCKPDIFAQTYREERGYPYDRPEHAQAAAKSAITEAVDTAVAQERERYASKFRGAEVVAYIIRKPGHKMSLAWEGEASVAIAREAGAVIEPLCSPQAVAELSENKSE